MAVCGQWLIVRGLRVDFMLLDLPHKLPPTQHPPFCLRRQRRCFFWPSCNSLDSLHHAAISDFYVFCFFTLTDSSERARAPFFPLNFFSPFFPILRSACAPEQARARTWQDREERGEEIKGGYCVSARNAVASVFRSLELCHATQSISIRELNS